MPPLYRIDAGKQIYYALDDAERDQTLARIAKENARSKPSVHPLQGLGRDESLAAARDHHRSAHPPAGAADHRGRDNTDQLMDMLLAKKRAGDRREWLESKGNLAEIQV